MHEYPIMCLEKIICGRVQLCRPGGERSEKARNLSLDYLLIHTAKPGFEENFTMIARRNTEEKRGLWENGENEMNVACEEGLQPPVQVASEDQFLGQRRDKPHANRQAPDWAARLTRR
jgi:hypothetical protein